MIHFGKRIDLYLFIYYLFIIYYLLFIYLLFIIYLLIYLFIIKKRKSLFNNELLIF